MQYIETFIANSVANCSSSLFLTDIKANKYNLNQEINSRSICVIGGAGSIGTSFLKQIIRFKPSKLVVIDLNENGLAELTRDLRSSSDIVVPPDYRTYTLDFASPIFERIFREEKGFDIVANFSAHKHVRSERDKYSVQALIENNDIKAKKLMDLLCEYPPKHFFCVSTDKAANPVNIMGASKRVLEDIVMAYSDKFKVTTARFANVLYSNGSLPDSWNYRLAKRQPLVAPSDVKRYFVKPEEAGQICLMACILGKTGEVFFPKLKESQMMTFKQLCDSFMESKGLIKHECSSEEEAKAFAARMTDGEYTGKEYPVYYSTSNTTGEKSFEEFYVEGEELDMNRFESLGVVTKSTRRPMEDVNNFLTDIQNVFDDPFFTKEDVVNTIKSYLPNFVHEEKCKNLDQKM